MIYPSGANGTPQVMDEKRKPAASWMDEDAAADDLGATGVFAAVSGQPNAPSAPAASAPPAPLVRPQAPRPQGPPLPPAGPAANVQEPLVHKVAVSGASGAPVNLLELLRSNTTAMDAGRNPGVEPRWPLPPPQLPATPPVSGGGQPAAPSEGFTQLLRALGGEGRAAAPSAAPAEQGFTAMLEGGRAPVNAPAPPAAAASSEASFTALLQNVPQAPKPYAPPASPEPRYTPPAADAPGGFTALLQGAGSPKPTPSSWPAAMPPEPRYNPPAAADSPGGFTALLQGVPAPQPPARPVPAEAPGGFTQLLQGFQPGDPVASRPQPPIAPRPEPFWPAAAAPAPVTYPEPPSQPAAASSGSFTQLFGSLSSSPEAGTPLDSGLTSEMPAYRPTVASGAEPSFTQVMAMSEPPKPMPSRPSGESRVPFSGYDPGPQRPLDAAPVLPPIAQDRPPQNDFVAGGAGMTQMLRRLQVQPEPAPFRPTEKYVPPSQPASPGPNTSFSGLYNELGGTPSAPPAPPAAPRSVYFEPAPAPVMPAVNPQQPARGEVTTILEMSKLRELARQGAAAPGSVPAAAPSGPATLQAWAPRMPAAPTMPQAPGPITLPAMAAPQFAPPQYAPPAVPAAPSAPAMPAVPAAPKGMQQYIPLFLVAIIFLLIVILITVVFLLKH